MNDRETRVKVFKKDTEGNDVCNSVGFTNYCVKLFFNAQHILLKLNPYERCFFDFLCEQMKKENNKVFIDKPLKEEFLRFLQLIDGDPKKIDAIDGYVVKLTDYGLIIRSNDRALYVVNPKYVFKGPEKDRIKCLTEILQTRIDANKPLKFLIGTTEERFHEGFKPDKRRW